jgi:GR25 family glycosyltransferase involved in LPS biosynthesis
MGIKLNVWSPYDGRSSAPLPGEYGVWVSTIRTWQFIVKNKIDSMLVLEDDILLEDNFVSNLNECVDQLPEYYDFLSLYYFYEQNSVDKNTDCGAKNIHRSLNQYSAGQATLYSYYGAKKLLKLVGRLGIEYTSDCFIFNKSQQGLVNGYSIKPNDLNFLKHDYKNIKSLIDTENIRNVEM